MFDHGRAEPLFLDHGGDQATAVVVELFEALFAEITLILCDIDGNLLTHVIVAVGDQQRLVDRTHVKFSSLKRCYGIS